MTPMTTAATRNATSAATLTLMIRRSGQRRASAMAQCHHAHVVVERAAVEPLHGGDHMFQQWVLTQASGQRVLDQLDQSVDVEPPALGADAALDQAVGV